MLEKASNIPTSKAATVSSTRVKECQSFVTSIAYKLHKYLSHTRNKMQHEISNIIFAVNQELFDVLYRITSPSAASQVSYFTNPSFSAS
jgi:hypothetical protein